MHLSDILTDERRLAALDSLAVLDTPPEREFDALTKLAAQVCGTPFAAVTLVATDRLFFKSRFGFDAPPPVAAALGSATGAGVGLLEVPDAAVDERFRDHEYVSALGLRFYAGSPLTTPDGVAVGALCVFDGRPGQLRPEQREALVTLAAEVMARLQLRQTVAELVATQAAVRAEKDRFRAVFDSTYQYISLLDPAGTILEANRAALEGAGVSADEVIGLPFWEAVWWRHNPALQVRLKDGIRRAAGGEVARFEAEHPLADGTLASIDFSLTPIRDAAGAVVMLVPEGRDVTDRTRAEEKFRMLFEHSSDAYLIHDDRDGVVDCNRAAVEMLRYRDKAEVLGLHSAALSPEFQPDGRLSREKAVEMAAAARRHGRYRFDWTHRRDDGDEFPCEVILTPVAMHGRSVLLAVWHDLTERRQSEEALRMSEAQFRTFMDNSPAVAYMKDGDGRFVYVNGPICRRFGIAEADWIGKTDADLWAAEIAGPVMATDRAVLASGNTVSVLETVRLPAGETSHWQSYKFPFTDADGRHLLAGMSVEVTAERIALAALTESEDRFRRVVEELTDGIVLLDFDTLLVLRANSSFLNLLGYTAAEAAGMTKQDFSANKRADIDEQRVTAALDVRQMIGFRRYRHKDGRLVDVSVSGSHMSLNGRSVLCLVVRDMTEWKRYERQLIDYQHELEAANVQLTVLATTDALTGVGNRAAFDEVLTAAYERATRLGRPLALLLFDVDHFKRFNDAHGHPAGDAVLAGVGRLLREAARGTDFVARYGGEEFVVVLPDTDLGGAMVFAERCRRAVAAEDWNERSVTVSVGVATLNEATGTRFALIAEADQALYESKRTGRNRVHFGGALPVQA